MIPLGVPGLLWKFKSEIAVVALSILIWGLRAENKSLKATIAARPAVESHTEKSATTKTIVGPTRTVEKFVVVPGKCDPVLIERTITAEPVTIEKIVEVTKDRTEKPICENKSVPRWLVGASADPFHAEDGQTIRVGTTIAGRLDLTVGRSTKRDRSEIGFAVRF